MPESSPFSQSLGNQQHEILLRAKPEDFDGHSEFHRLTPEQRLTWLDQAVAFIQATKTAHQSSTMLLTDLPS
jgi:hypothetical protein